MKRVSSDACNYGPLSSPLLFEVPFKVRASFGMRSAVFRSKQAAGRAIRRRREDGPLRGIERDTSNTRTLISVSVTAEVIDLLASRISAPVRREVLRVSSEKL